MQSSDIPGKMPVPFASAAGSGYVTNPIPQTPPSTPGMASFQTGFPPLTFEQTAAGGDPPFGKDFNGILLGITQWLRWAQAGGLPPQWDSAFAASVGGYPKNALVLSATPGYGHYWLCTAENNTTNPDAGGSGWARFPDALIQIQGGNYAVDTGAQNQVRIALSRTPASLAEIVGAPIRFVAAFTNSINNPQIFINGLPPCTMVNADGSAMAIGQLIANGNSIADGFVRTDGAFQINNPVKPFSPAANFPPPGFVMPWPTESPPSGFLECNGAALSISAYPNLWAVLGTRYGGDGVNTFRVPDYRGEFLRGWDHGRGLDPNAGSRTNAGGGITGDHVGTNEGAAINGGAFNGVALTITNEAYGGIVTDTGAGGNPGQGLPFFGSNLGGGSSTTGFVTGTGVGAVLPLYITQISGQISISGLGVETRPVNINVMWVIFAG